MPDEGRSFPRYLEVFGYMKALYRDIYFKSLKTFFLNSSRIWHYLIKRRKWRSCFQTVRGHSSSISQDACTVVNSDGQNSCSLAFSSKILAKFVQLLLANGGSMGPFMHIIRIGKLVRI